MTIKDSEIIVNKLYDYYNNELERICKEYYINDLEHLTKDEVITILIANDINIFKNMNRR